VARTSKARNGGVDAFGALETNVLCCNEDDARDGLQKGLYVKKVDFFLSLFFFRLSSEVAFARVLSCRARVSSERASFLGDADRASQETAI
jgi:hypothetical protein